MSDPLNIDNLPPLREVIAAHDLHADKSLGQNFLLDLNITDKIARSACGHNDDLSGTTVFEIGPGPGGLTRSLLKAGAEKVIAVEFDPRAVAALQDLVVAADGRLEVVQGDALNTDLLSLAPESKKRTIVANLPYNIATPLLFGWLKQIRENRSAYDTMILMFQREVGDRIIAQPNPKKANKAYGRLAVMTNWLCETSRVFDLPPSVFMPPPKITSSVVRFIPRQLPDDPPPFKDMEVLVRDAFSQRRKMIRSTLKKYKDNIAAAGLDETLRAEQLTIEDFLSLL